MSKRALVIDDSPVVQMIVSQILTSNGIETTTSSTRQEALDAVQNSDFDLVCVDWKLGHDSGIELISQLRQNSRYHSTPIFLITTESSERQQEGLDAGATAFLSKPFQPPDLQALLRAYNVV